MVPKNKYYKLRRSVSKNTEADVDKGDPVDRNDTWRQAM